MKRFSFDASAFVAVLVAMGAFAFGTIAYSQESAMQAMTRGPIHEAFAQPVNSGAVTPLVVPKEPPKAIEEMPPDAKPAGENVIWINGYWSWDDDRKDFVWTSGVWRASPPNQRWVAGYWTEVSGGYSWVPGFWAPAEQQEIAYYPDPPASLEEGPTSDQPAADDVWISGCWRWNDSRYAWQPGHWAQAREDWIWVPASYYWSPRGWIFCDGYWDYRLEDRGLLFAPVYFTGHVYRGPGRFFSPSVVLDSGLLTFYLFVRPTYDHYYFGDYYAANYDRLGIYPWFAVRRNTGYAYDPLFTYYNWRNVGHDPDWAKNLESWHTYYRAHPNERLPHDWASVQRLAAEGDKRPDRQFLAVADTLQNQLANPKASVRLASLSSEDRTKFQQSSRLMQQFETERAHMELRGANGAEGRTAMSPGLGAAAKLKAPETLQLPKVARTLTEGLPSGARQTLKPITPLPAEKPLQETPRQAQKPSYPPLPEKGLNPEKGERIPFEQRVPNEQRVPKEIHGLPTNPSPEKGMEKLPKDVQKPFIPNPPERNPGEMRREPSKPVLPPQPPAGGAGVRGPVEKVVPEEKGPEGPPAASPSRAGPSRGDKGESGGGQHEDRGRR